MNKMPLAPLSRQTPNMHVIGEATKYAGKRLAGGRAQLGRMSFDALAEVVVPTPLEDKGGFFDRQNKKQLPEKRDALRRVFAEFGWPAFEDAIVIAVVRKNSVDGKDGFIPLALGSIDVEAGLKNPLEHKELQIHGLKAKGDHDFAEAVAGKVGLATEYGNDGDSLEVIIPVYVPGDWKEVEDTQFDPPRRTGIVIVTPTVTLYCEGMSINGLQTVPAELLSVKSVEAIKIAQQLCRECNIA